MLSDQALQLLTASVDGELSSRQREAVTRLLQESAEARQLLKELQQHANQIQQLPARKLDAGFSAEVVKALPLCIPAGKRPAPSGRRRPAWVRIAVAASVLVVVAGGAVWLMNRQPHADAPQVAKNNGAPPAPRVDHGPLVARVVEGAFSEFARPLPPERPGTKLPFDELAKTQWHEHLVQGMTNQQAVHLDVAVSNQRQAVQRLETVLQNKGVRVVIDPPARSQLAKNPSRSQYVIYAENIRPDELAAMLYELGTDERARTSIESLTVSTVTADDQQQLSALLGIKREELQTPPPPSKTLKQFIPKADDKSDRDAAGNPVRAPAAQETRVAMILAHDGRGRAASSELQYFLGQRRQLQPGALQVIVVVHEA